MAKQIQVDLIFNANTAQAKAQVQNLQQSLNSLQSSTTNNLFGSNLTAGMQKDIAQAQTAVASLKANLSSAFNVDTGKLDLNKFNTNLMNSGMKLKDYRNALQTLGPEGVKSFNQLTQAIVQGQLPLQKTNGLLNSMMTTFGNTLKWQVASSAIRGISSTFSEAFQYAQDLNESLTNIRIVTGKGADEMARFAEQANRAAKALATSTTAYTDAALIYYQQGLDGKAVEERAATTLKLANVTGQNAEEISQQLTAVWNNFYDGSKNLEYYADVMTALGAATASSSDEIAQGLEKFAAVADTVGLSYEYATTALATVTAQTRQSADVVGTAFKTIFARIQDLELGNTLEDGTTLGKYSEALAKVGVDIKDASGGLKDMDIILSEMGAKWQQIDKDQQVALAKSVAGIRQYTQLIALMDNWDTFEMNLDVTANAEGSLQEQQDIWAESWEAAQKRVQASAEGLYKSLINDEFFIDLNNMFADLLTGVDKFIEAMGGMKSLLPFLAGWIMKAFGPMALSAIQQFGTQLKGVSAEQQAMAMNLRKEALKQNSLMGSEVATQEATAQSEAAERQLGLLESIENIGRNLNKHEIERLQTLIEEQNALSEIVQLYAQAADKVGSATKGEAAKRVEESQYRNMAKRDEEILTTFVSNDRINSVNSRMSVATTQQKSIDEFLSGQYMQDGQWNQQMAKQAMQNINGIAGIDTSSLQGTQAEFEGLTAILSKFDLQTEAATQGQQELRQAFRDLGITDMDSVIEEYMQSLLKANQADREAVNINREKQRSIKKVEEATNQVTAATEKAKAQYNAAILEMQKMNKIPLSKTIMDTAGAVGMLAGGVNTFISGFQSLTEMFKSGEHSIQGWLTALMSMGMALPMILNSLKGFGTLSAFLNQRVITANSLTVARTALLAAEGNEEKQLIALKAIGLKQEQAEAIQKGINIALADAETKAGRKLTKEEEKEVITKTLLAIGYKETNKEKGNSIIKTWLQEKATKKKVAADSAETKGLWAKLAAMVATNWILALILAALVILVATIWLVVKAMKAAEEPTFEEKLNAIKETSDDLKTSLDELRNSVEELQNAWNNYDNAVDALDNLTKGSQEWYEQIEKINEQVTQLLEKYPELQDMITIDENGMLVLDKTKYDKYTNDKEKVENSLTLGTLIVEQDKKNIEADKAKADITNTQYTSTISGNYYREPGSAAAGFFETEYSGQHVIRDAIKQGLLTPGETLTEEKLNSILKELNAGYKNEYGDKKNFKPQYTANQEEKAGLILEYNKLAANYTNKNNQANANTGFELQAGTLYSKNLYTVSNGEKKYYNEEIGYGAAARAYGERILADANNNYDQNYKQYENSEITGTTSVGLTNYLKTQYGEDATVEFKKGKTLINGEETENSAVLTGFAAYEAANKEDNEQYFYEASEAWSKAPQWLIDFQTGKSVDVEDIDGYDTKTDTINGVNIDSYFKTNFADLMNNYGLDINAFKTGFASETTRAEKFNEAYLQDANWLETTKANNWFNNLSEEDQKIAINLIPEADSVEKLKTQVSDAINNQIKDDEQKFLETEELDEDKFNTYKDLLKTNINEELKQQGKTIQDLYKNVNDYNRAISEIAKTNMRMEKGVKTLASKWDDYNEVMTDSNASAEDLKEIMPDVNGAIQDILNLDATEFEALPETFAKDNWGLIQDVMNGVEGSIDRLRDAAGQSILMEIDGVVDADGNIKSELQAIHDTIATMDQADFTVGVALDPQKHKEFIDNCNSMIQAAGMTAEQAQAYFKSMGYDVELKEVKPESKDTSTYSYYELDEEATEKAGGVPQFKKEPTEISVTSSSGATAYAIETITPTGSYGGGVGVTTTAPKSATKAANKSGGGGSKSKKDPKKSKDEIERYHEIKEEMDDLARATEKAAKAKDHAFGDDKVKAIEKEIAAIDKEIKAYDRLIAENEKYLKQDKVNLSKYGAKFDAEGRVSNYDEMIQAQVDKYNRAVAQFNSGSLSEEAFKKYEEDYELFKEYLEQYEETLNEYESNVEAQADKTQEVIDKRLEKIDTVVSLNIEVNEAQFKALELRLKKLDDDQYDSAERVKHLTDQMTTKFSDIENYSGGIAAILKEAGATTEQIQKYLAGDASAIANLNLSQEEIDSITQYTDDIMSANEEIDELRKTIEEQVMTTFTAWHEEIEEVGDKLSSFNSILENFRNIIDTIGKDRLGISDAVLADMEAASMGTLSAQVTNAKAQLDYTKSALADAQKQLADAQARGDQSAIEMWENTIKELDQQMITDAENFTSVWSEAISAAGEVFESQMERAFENFEKSISGMYGSLDKLSESFEKQSTLSEKFLDPSQKLYEISKLNRQIQKEMDKTDNVRSQQKLLEIQEMIHEYEKEGAQMSQRDLDALQKRYELKLAEIALEDAQNAKSQVRLQRDSEGNFGYVYTADQNAVADAQQKYEDALNANRELAVSQQQELINSIVSNRQAMVEALREIRIEDYEDTAAYEQALAECAEYYTGLEAYYVDELNKVIERSQDIYENDFLAYDGWNLSKISSTEYLNEALGTADSGLYGEMGQNAQGWVDGFGKQMEEMGFEKGHLGTVKNGATLLRDALGTAGKEGTLFGDIHKNAVTWQSNIDTVMDKAGTSMEDFKKTTEKAMYGEGGTKDKPTGGVVKATEEAAKKTENLKKTALDMFNSTSTKVGEWQKAYSNKVDAATTSVNNLADAIAKLKDIKINFKFDADGNLIIEDGNKPKPTNPPPQTPTNNTSTDSNNQNSGKPTWERVVAAYNRINAGAWGNGLNNRIAAGAKEGFTEQEVRDAQTFLTYLYTKDKNGYEYGWDKAKQLTGYDTGGYTGEWGPDGRLALLHQKEIVLNAHDTENLLTAVSMIREISAQLESNALAMRYLTTVDNYNAALKTAGDTLQQEVHITAEFPNATDHSEIEEAFRNLNNLASQYANRK